MINFPLIFCFYLSFTFEIFEFSALIGLIVFVCINGNMHGRVCFLQQTYSLIFGPSWRMWPHVVPEILQGISHWDPKWTHRPPYVRNAGWLLLEWMTLNTRDQRTSCEWVMLTAPQKPINLWLHKIGSTKLMAGLIAKMLRWTFTTKMDCRNSLFSAQMLHNALESKMWKKQDTRSLRVWWKSSVLNSLERESLLRNPIIAYPNTYPGRNWRLANQSFQKQEDSSTSDRVFFENS